MNTSFERVSNGKDEWLTPPEIIKALGEFDLDPCSPILRPWDTAEKHYSLEDNGLIQPWEGRVWLNPPYGRQAGLWLKRMAEHGNGIVLLFCRTDTNSWFRYVWPYASGVMFLKGRLRFYNADGTRANNDAGSPSALVSYGAENAAILENSGLDGKFIRPSLKGQSLHAECPGGCLPSSSSFLNGPYRVVFTALDAS